MADQEIDQSNNHLMCTGAEYKKIKGEWQVLSTDEHESVQMIYDRLLDTPEGTYYVYKCPICNREVPV